LECATEDPLCTLQEAFEKVNTNYVVTADHDRNLRTQL
jgi:hypothetical protein